MPQTLKSSGENTNQLKYIKTLQFWWLKTPIILLGKLFEHSGDICWDLCYNETIEFFESNLIWILRWQWHCIILWECFRISLMPKLFHLFTAKNISSLHWQCICIIFGDNVLGSLYCQKTLISSIPMYLNLFIDNVFAAVWCQRWFSSWDSSFRSLHWQSLCCILECVHSSLCYCDVHEVMTTFLCLFWRLCEKRIWRKEKKLFWLFSVPSLWIFSLFFFGIFSKKFWEKKSKSEKEKN